ncbi:MAG: ABC transporter permease [Pseudomonas sp.]|jgi:ABC-2 type transport system permease protein|nr:ABC transporter permease [Pseudomonas sp.]
MRLWALIRKEVLLLRRDWHALSVLFLMPASFLVLMAFAMSGLNQDKLPPLHINLQVEQHSTDSDFFISALQAQLSDSQLQQTHDNQQPTITIEKEFSTHLLDTPHTGPSLSFPAATDQLSRQRIHSAVTIALAQTRLRAFLIDSQLLDSQAAADEQLALVQARTQSALPEYDVLSSGSLAAKANASQLSVPAWLIFGMFFVMLPMANSFQYEQQSGTLLRFRGLQLNFATLALSKLLPYIGINFIQFVSLLALGVFALPALGLPALQIGEHLSAYFLLALCIAMASCSLGLLIAALAKNTEQALLLSAGSNIILAAIGGVMVPKSIMPLAMQQLAELSPMSWALDAFLTLLVGQGSTVDILPWCLRLLGFALLCSSGGLLLFRRRVQQTLWTTHN